MEKIFDGKKVGKLGTPKNPAAVTVKTKKRLKEVSALFEKNGWHFFFEISVLCFYRKPEMGLEM